jgi:uncharacterized protein (DUF362 family)/ferredoxin
MMMKKVALMKCADYDQKNVDKAVEDGLALLGGLEKYIRPGMRVLLKVNLLMKKKPEDCTTTHPAVVEALVKAIQKIGAYPVIGDSPGGPFLEGILRGIYEATGMGEVAERTGAELFYDTGTVDVCYPEGRLLKKITISSMVHHADAVISVGKLKTHGMTGYTGAVKNLFGVIPGVTKVEYHFRMPDLRNFSDMLVDLCEYVKPVLSVIDGIVGMEGAGPSAGDPRKVGALILSDCPHSADVTGISLMGVDPLNICTIQRARERGIITGVLKDVRVLGTPVEDLLVKDFKLALPHDIHFMKGRFPYLPKSLEKRINNWLTPKPVFMEDVCKGCWDCERNCPPKAIKMVDRKPQVDLEQCIRCFCCQELCPHMAVQIKRPWIFRRIK